VKSSKKRGDLTYIRLSSPHILFSPPAITECAFACSSSRQQHSHCISHDLSGIQASFVRRSPGCAQLRRSDWDTDTTLRKFRHKLCKDPGDRVYSLLGLIKRHGLPNIQRDYGLTIDQVLLQAMSTLTEQSDHDLRYFTSLGLHSTQYGIPSWVRNFSAALDSDGATHKVSRYNSYPLYNAACSTKADLGVLSD
jgi:hypothetical protein